MSGERAGRWASTLARRGWATPSLKSRGSDPRLLTCSVVITSPKQPMHERLPRLYDELTRVVRVHQPDEMAVEELFFAKNVTTAVTVGQARGVALLVAAQAGLSVFEYKPMQVKQAVHGYGLATKEQVGEMVRVLLRLDSRAQAGRRRRRRRHRHLPPATTICVWMCSHAG